jgi:hypothetical protein
MGADSPDALSAEPDSREGRWPSARLIAGDSWWIQGNSLENLESWWFMPCYTGWWFGNMEFYDFPFSWEFHHPNWRTHIFQRGRYTTNQAFFTLKIWKEPISWANWSWKIRSAHNRATNWGVWPDIGRLRRGTTRKSSILCIYIYYMIEELWWMMFILYILLRTCHESWNQKYQPPYRFFGKKTPVGWSMLNASVSGWCHCFS